MRSSSIRRFAALVMAVSAPVFAHSAQPGSRAAAALSAVVGGTLDSDQGEAGALAHPIDWASIPLHLGRSVEYRRRVALEMQVRLTAGRR